MCCARFSRPPSIDKRTKIDILFHRRISTTVDYMYNRYVLFLLALFLSPILLSQPRGDDPRIRLAQSYEKGGRIEEAAALYAELYRSDSTNIVYFDGLRRMYVQLKRYDDAIALLKGKLSGSRDDVMIRVQLGSVLYKAGRDREAQQEWDQAIAVDPLNPGYYRAVAGALTENRLLEQTVELYRRARTATGNNELFTLELAQLLGSTMNYRGAMAEYASWLRKNPTQLSFVQQKISPFTSRHEGRREAIAGMQEAIGGGEEPALLELLAWLYLEDKDYAAAYDVCRVIDRASAERGSRIYAFAEQAFREKAYAAASEAYLEAIRIPVPATRVAGAYYGYANCLKELSSAADSSDETSSAKATEAMERFEEIISKFPGTEYAVRARFQIGLLQYERFHDLDGSLASFAAVERELPESNTVSYAVSLMMGEVLTMRGDSAEAAQRFRVVMNAPGALPDQQDEATFRLAELAYFRGEVQTATDLLGSLALDLQLDYANDALRLLTFLRENSKASGEALNRFARADYLGRQRHYAEAAQILLDVVDKNPRALLVDDALLLAGKLQTDNGDYRQAIGTYQKLIKEFPETSIALDRAWFAIGEIHQFRFHDANAATEAYQSLLSAFPNSLLTEQARKRIRDLRGESM